MGVFLPKPFGLLSVLAALFALQRSNALQAQVTLLQVSGIYVTCLALLQLGASGTITQLVDNLEACLNVTCGMAIGIVAFAATQRLSELREEWGILICSWTALLAHLALPKVYESSIVFFGFFNNPNTSARVLCVLLAILILINPKFTLKERSKKIVLFRIGHILAIVVTCYLLILTNYRSAWLAGAIGVGIWIFGSPQRTTPKKLALLVISIASILFLFALADHKGFASENNSIHSRLNLWSALLNGWIHQRPWQGFGIGSFASLEYLYQGLHTPTVYPHNAIVEVISLSGITGFCITLFCGLRIYKIESRIYKVNQDSPISRIAIACLGSTALLLMLDVRFYGDKSFALIYACLGALNASAPKLQIAPSSTQTDQK